MKNHIFYGLKKLFIIGSFFAFGLSQACGQDTVLTLKHAGTMHTHGTKSDVKIIVSQGQFPDKCGDIIVNDAHPSLLGFLHAQPSPVDAAVFHAAGGGLAASKGSVVFDSEIEMPQNLKQQVIQLFKQDQIVYQDDDFVVKPSVPAALKNQIEQYIKQGALIHKNGIITAISPQDNRLKKSIEDLKTKKILPAQGQVGVSYKTPALNIDGAHLIIHAVVPHDRNAEMLRAVIKSCLKNAVDFTAHEKGKNAHSIAFPSLAVHYGFPLDQAAQIIIASVAGFIQSHGNFPLNEIRFVLANDAEYAKYSNALYDYAHTRKNKQANDNGIVVEQQCDSRVATMAPTQHKNAATKSLPNPSKTVADQKPLTNGGGASDSKAPQHVGFFDTMKQVGWDTSLFDLPGIVGTACKNGWYGSAKDSQPEAAQKPEVPAGWGVWFNRNFNTICLSALGLLAVKQCI